MQLAENISELRIGGLIMMALFAGLLIMSGCDRRPKSPPSSPVPEVATVTVQPQPIVLTTELPGRTSAYRVAEIRPQVNGLIQKRLFTEGSDVKAGQVLYQIDPAPFQAAFDNAAANLAAVRKAADRARATLAASIAGVTRQRATLDSPERTASDSRSCSRTKPSPPASATKP